MTHEDMRLLFLSERYHEYQNLYDLKRLTEEEYLVQVDEIEEEAAADFGNKQVLYDFINSKNLK